jgi:PIN domain nuclease of toxin-antitoxin system
LAAIVFDSYAVLAFLFDEAGADEVESILHEAAQAGGSVPISAVNWAEVLYRVRRVEGAKGVDKARQFERTMPVEVVGADRALAESAAELKAGHKLSLGDAFAAALAQQRNAELATGDPELRALEGTIRLRWLG